MTSPQQIPETPAEATPWLTPTVFAAIGVWLAAIAPVVVVGTVVNPGAMWQFQALWNRQVDSLYPYLLAMARYGWLDKTAGLGVSTQWDRSDTNLAELLQQSRNLLVRIPDEVYRQIIRTMAVGRDRGETSEQIAARVSNILDINGSENWLNRSAVIARTELNRFYQAGGLGSMRTTQQRTGRAVLKQWQDRDDAKVRRVHKMVDNELRRLGEPFHVGRSLLQQPVDPRGFPEDVINCRCDLDYRWAK